jgi:hypothetical protein
VLGKLGPPAQSAAQLSFGASGDYYQGRVIGNFHSGAVDAAHKVLGDLQKGLQAIAWAAQNIANDYQNADELNSMDLARVDGYFNPKDRSAAVERDDPSGPPTYQP